MNDIRYALIPGRPCRAAGVECGDILGRRGQALTSWRFGHFVICDLGRLTSAARPPGISDELYRFRIVGTDYHIRVRILWKGAVSFALELLLLRLNISF